MGRPVVHFEITGKDGPALHAFYSELFEWSIDAEEVMPDLTIGLFTDPEGHVIGLIEAAP